MALCVGTRRRVCVRARMALCSCGVVVCKLGAALSHPLRPASRAAPCHPPTNHDAGIVGITCAALGAHVMLTDMRDVLPQIYENVQSNERLIGDAGGSATVAELDWLDPDDEVGRQCVCVCGGCRLWCACVFGGGGGGGVVA
jgi:hypothetical protein